VATALIYDDRFLRHDVGQGLLYMPGIPEQESGERLGGPSVVRRSRHLLVASGLAAQLTEITPRLAGADELAYVHTPEYIAHIRACSDGAGGDAGSITPINTGTYEIAARAAGGAITAVDAVLRGEAANAFALLRPPGHHALADFGMGGCIFGNVAIAACRARRRGLARVAIVDWDVHHGNGTQAAFYDDPSVLFISLHQDGLYPEGSGPETEVGGGAARGYNVNIPLPAGTSEAGYLHAFERVVIPVLRQFAPELILVSAGLDASIYDQMGRMMVSSEGFRTMTRLVKAVADETSQGRLAICMEGGYSPVYVPFCVLTMVEELSGVRSRVADPFLPSINLIPTVHRVTIEVEQAVLRVVELQRSYWEL